MDGPTQDHELMARLVTGEQGALEELYDRHSRIAFAVIVRIVHDRQIAEEVLQETFLRAWQHAGSYEGERGRLRPWLLRIAHNLALNERRRQTRRPQLAVPRDWEETDAELGRLPDPSPQPADVAWATVRRLEIVQALEQLPQPQRSVIELYADGYSQLEVATLLDQPLGTVKTRMRRGLQALRAVLQTRGFDVDVD